MAVDPLTDEITDFSINRVNGDYEVQVGEVSDRIQIRVIGNIEKFNEDFAIAARKVQSSVKLKG